MNRITTLFFALLLTTLWIFGLMIAHRKSAGARGAVMPTLSGEDVKIEKVIVKHKEGGKDVEDTFENIGDRWFLKDNGQQVRVEGFRIDGMVRQIKDAKNDETADVEKVRIEHPDVTVTLVGKAKEQPKEWKFYVGKENVGLMYVSSSDHEGKVFAVPKRSIDNVLFVNANNFRSKRLFDFVDTSVTGIIIKKADKELELKREESGVWMFIRPALGVAGFGAEPPPEPKNPHEPPKPPPPATSGVKALLTSIVNIRVDDDNDFEPLGSPVAKYGLEKGKESMKIEIVSAEKGDKKESPSEILLIGLQDKKRNDGTFYYARVADDDGVFQINAKYLEPIDKAVKDPGKIRSLDVAVFEEPKVDAVTLTTGKEEFQFFKTEPPKDELLPFQMPRLKTWEMVVGKEKKKADESAIRRLLEQVQGKKGIVEFLDVASDDAKKKDADWGFDSPAAVVSIYVNAIDKEKKDEAKEEKKDDKDKKDEKKDAGKKAEKDKKETLPALKKDAKPVVKLEFGRSDKDKDTVNVKRTLPDGTVSRFTVKKEILEKIVPGTGVYLAYLDTDLPEFPAADVVSLKVGRKTDRGTETIDLERRAEEGRPEWFVKDSLEPTGMKLAQTSLVDRLVEGLSRMHAKKWLKKLDDKEDLEKYGLKNPAAVISVTVKKQPFTPGTTEAQKALPFAAAAATVTALANSFEPHLLAASFAAGSRQADKGEVISISLGKDTDEEKDKPGTFALHSGTKLLFLLPPQFVREVRDTDFRDRAILMHVQGRMVASYLANAAGLPIELLMFASPQFSGQIFNLDADKVKEVRLEERTPFELRSFDFVRDAKDKSWTDKSNIPEFRLDSDKVNQFVKDIAKLKADRFVAFVGGPRGEHKLGGKEATVKLDLILDDGKMVTLLVGASYENQGYYATTSIWPETVFMLPRTTVEPMQRGAAQFAKERFGVN